MHDTQEKAEKDCEGSQENAIQNLPELHNHHCRRRVKRTVCLGPRSGPGGVRTGILLDYDGIVEIYHLDRQAT